MKNLAFVVVYLFVLSGEARVLQADLSPESFDFVAPVVAGESDVADKQVGQIVFDASANLFKGRVTDGSWVAMNGAAATAANSSAIQPASPGKWYGTGSDGNWITLGVGTWNIYGSVYFTYNTSSAIYNSVASQWSTAPGNGNVSPPTAVSVSAGNTSAAMDPSPANTISLISPTIQLTVTSGTQTIYLVPYANMTTATNARIYTNVFATRIK